MAPDPSDHLALAAEMLTACDQRPDSLEASLVELIHALKTVRQRAASRLDITERYDIRFEEVNLHRMNRLLDQLEDGLEEVCRLRLSYYSR